ncbi:hypothetical protein BASA50_004947 [Batrachochytrium salamandrivorans]|uniref:TFIID subunit TAF5 NTD2 domain-containing protein n=1 Tax=Batrachochytrium salamandrivorans TaxID=1357716 RepID=A0ABQ8FH37_9FUNG|nr:hypothetical protein BASA50_004947 [Batrachochytrium salamandrivorans]
MLYDLSQMAEPLNINILKHFFVHFDPSTSKGLHETIQHFHMRELESSDYRSAYHQFCDWLYGWDVSDAADYTDIGSTMTDYFHVRRVLRDIDINVDRERSEAVRLMKIFETLCSLSRRSLKKTYMDIEAEMPRLGQGLGTFTINKTSSSNSPSGDATGGIGLTDSLSGDCERVWGVLSSNKDLTPQQDMEDGSGIGDNEDGDKSYIDQNEETGLEVIDEENKDMEERDDDRRATMKDTKVQQGSKIRPLSSHQETRGSTVLVSEIGTTEDEGGMDADLEGSCVRGVGDDRLTEPGVLERTKGDLRGQKTAVDVTTPNQRPIDSLITSDAEGMSLTPRAPTGGSYQLAFGFLQPALAKVGPEIPRVTLSGGSAVGNGDPLSDTRRALQRDIIHVFGEVDRCTELTLVSMSSVLVVLSLAELLGDKEVYIKHCNLAHELSMDFVSNTLKTVWDLLNKEFPGEVTLADLRNPYELHAVLKRLMGLRASQDHGPKLRLNKLFIKFLTLHDIFCSTDIHIFPNFVAAHKEGLKCARFSVFDSSLWLTGGYDCIIRISDIRSANNHICLAQLVGHKSIVTDVHFTRNDSQVVSSSFDRTIRIWNTQQATVERTLIGHTDAVISCDVSVDERYIASGSTDGTVRFWDYNTGECTTIIRKHTRWVKVVRFSLDGRHLATAGLDKRVYIWDTKILANSRSPTHSRCIDSFGDYVLDMAMSKPTLLLTTSRDYTIRLFDYMSGHELHSVNLSPSWACSVSFSGNGEYFATGSFDNNVIIFQTRSFEKMREVRVFNLGIMCVRFPKDLSYVVVGTTEGFLQQIPL